MVRDHILMLNKITLDASEWHPFRTLSKIHGGIITMDSSSITWTVDVHRYAWRPIADEPVYPCTRQHIVISTASPMRTVYCNDQHYRMARKSLPTFSHSRPLYIISLYSAFEYAVEVIIQRGTFDIDAYALWSRSVQLMQWCQLEWWTSARRCTCSNTFARDKWL